MDLNPTGEDETDHLSTAGLLNHNPVPATPMGPRGATLAFAWQLLNRLLLIPSIADRMAMSSPLYSVLAFSPLHTLVLVLCIYVVIMVLWLPLFGLSYLITAPGVYVSLAVVIYLTGRLIARTLSYPGCLPTVFRDIEYEYSSQMVRKLENCSVKLKEWVADLRVVFNTTIPTPHPMLGRHHIEVCFIRKHMLGVLLEALRSLTAESKLVTELRLSESAARDAKQLLDVIEKVVGAIDDVMPIAQRVVAIHAPGMPQSFRHISMSCSSSSQCPQDAGPHNRVNGNHVCGSSGTGLEHLEALVEAADQIERVVPSFRRERPVEQGGMAMVKHWIRARKPWDNVMGSHLMREELCRRLQARQLWVSGGADGVKLDCCFIPARRLHASSGKSLGVVLYCNPNAGHYECFTHTPFSSDWVDFYTSLGCDMFLFNYRGYGRSTGKADPHAINQDAELIVRYLREDMGYTRIAVHGESIGGMVACHVARHCEGVELLVADRTFCTLDAVADRLMGQWAGRAMQFFTGWQTDVVSDYMAAPCYKLVCCDPNDQIISDGASLKVGVAVRRELGDVRHRVRQVPLHYLLAESRGLAPSAAIGSKNITPPNSPDEKLTEAKLEHFAACLRYIALCCKQHDQMTRGLRGDDQRSSLASYLEGDGKVYFDTDSEMSEAEDSEDDRESHDGSPRLGHVATALTPLQMGMDVQSRSMGATDGKEANTRYFMWEHHLPKGAQVSFSYNYFLGDWDLFYAFLQILENSNSVRRDFPSALPLQSVTMSLEEVVQRHGSTIQSLPQHGEIAYVIDMIRYLDNRVRRDLEQLVEGQHRAVIDGPKQRGSRRSPEAAAVVGHLLPLQCGHNTNFSELERERFLYHLACQGWAIDQFDDL